MTFLKIIYKALVMEHCLSKVEDLNRDWEPPFPFFKFSFSCMRVCVCVYLFYSCLYACMCLYLFILLMSLFLILLAYNLILLCLLFTLFWYCFYSWQERPQDQPSKGVSKQVYRLTPMPKFDIEITIQRGCYLVNMLHNFITSLSKNTSWGLPLQLPP